MRTYNPPAAHLTDALRKRFWAKVQKTDGCWLWTGSKTQAINGYGDFYVRGENYRAHRVSYLMESGPIPDGMCVCHRCDNPPCVRPSHLFLGTKGDNNRDMVSKGRSVNPLGERHGCAKLTEQQVLAIRADARSEHAIARAYLISPANVQRIKVRKLWRHI